ncbi:hypothetical protein P8936_16325 [Edaphobacter paludis]|uniref:Cold shock domain-containing protein n=1 Tax=Edaphobacter paludis TaxID=3035702 RepID=A0AAU7D7V9_9BACT
MTLVGFIKRINRDYCFIRVPTGQEYFAHKRDFKDPSLRRLGQYVQFTPLPPIDPSKNPPATDVEAIAA